MRMHIYINYKEISIGVLLIEISVDALLIQMRMLDQSFWPNVSHFYSQTRTSCDAVGLYISRVIALTIGEALCILIVVIDRF